METFNYQYHITARTPITLAATLYVPRPSRYVRFSSFLNECEDACEDLCEKMLRGWQFFLFELL